MGLANNGNPGDAAVLDQVLEEAARERENGRLKTKLSSYPPYEQHEKPAMWDKDIVGGGETTGKAVYAEKGWSAADTIENWHTHVAREVRKPVIGRLLRRGVPEKLGIKRPSGSRVIRHLDVFLGADANLLEQLIDTYALMQLNHGEHEFFSQKLLREDIKKLERAIIGESRAKRELLGKVYHETENWLRIFSAYSAPNIDETVEAIINRQCEKHHMDRHTENTEQLERLLHHSARLIALKSVDFDGKPRKHPVIPAYTVTVETRSKEDKLIGQKEVDDIFQELATVVMGNFNKLGVQR